MSGIIYSSPGNLTFRRIPGSGLSFLAGLIDGNSIDQSSLFLTPTQSRPWKFIQLMNSLKARIEAFSVYSSSESRVNVEYSIQTFFVSDKLSRQSLLHYHQQPS